jgi:hypothetical protein
MNHMLQLATIEEIFTMKPINKFVSATSILLALSLQVTADEVILNDVIIDGSLCVGQVCADGEVFDFDTIKLKSSNPLIRFVDTSTTAAFPSQDWSMGVVDRPVDISVFVVKDANANTTVLQLSASPGGGVALGADAELVDGTISVGAAGTERRIVHVADGVNPSDAVKHGQVQPQLDNLQAAINAVNVRVDDLLTRLDNL